DPGEASAEVGEEEVAVMPASSGRPPTGRTPRRSGTFRRAGLSGRGRDVERCPARLGQHGGYALARAPLPYRGDKATTDQFTRGGLIAEGQPVDEEVRYAAAGEFGHVLGHRSQGGPLSMVQLDDRPRHGRTPFLLPDLSPGCCLPLKPVIPRSHCLNVADDTNVSRCLP